MFKNRNFLDDVKVMYTDLINKAVDREEDKLRIFDASGPCLATKKIGKNNPREEEIRSDNQLRQEWNQTVDQVLIAGGSQEEVRLAKRALEQARRAQAEWNGIALPDEDVHGLQTQRVQDQKPSVRKQLAAMKTEAPGRGMNHVDKKLSGKELRTVWGGKIK